jgi:Flp pilus assembly protein TadG
MTALLRMHIRSDRGAALIELAVALPLLVLIFAATIDFARVFYASIALNNAARAGALYGSANVAQSSDTAGMQAVATASIVPNTGVAATATRLCQCAPDGGTPFTATSPVNSCTTPEATACSGGRHRVITVTVTTRRTFSTIMGTVPGIPNSVDLTRSATLRVAN